jgi:hypothetical protein
MTVTLPEVTIVGDPNSVPVTVADWYAQGFTVGWKDPGVKPEPPAPLNEETLSSYFAGVSAGSQARKDIEDEIDDDNGPAVEPDIGGPLFEEVDRKYRETFLKFLEHEDPHSEEEMHVDEPPPLPNIVFVP